MNNIPEFSVTEFSNLTKKILEENFSLIKIRGEISSVKNFRGHIYFTLKDENYVVNSVCWSSKVPFLQVQPEDGLEVVVEGKISTYARSSISTYQIQVNQIEIKGEGALLKLIEQRKKKLEAEGLFNAENKKQIPFLPNKIGVITSLSGAVVMDIIDRVSARFPTDIKLYSVSVQGVNAVNEIILGLDYFEKYPVDLVIIARGGGGIEDLMPFNDEKLVRRVFSFSKPTISAIGHETDFTLLDFVSDVRAATPTAAAELAVPEIKNLREKIFFFENSLKQSITNQLVSYSNFIQNIKSFFLIKNLKKSLIEKEKIIFFLLKNLNSNLNLLLSLKASNFKRISSILYTLDIQNTLKRGFVLIKDNNKKIIKRAEFFQKKKDVNIKFFDREFNVKIKIKND
tara:strand:+ start:1092 stop:2288 length:1197 start_codon:yes stop_codon:yes gene_type:complete